MPHLSGPRRYFFHHSYKVLSLQNYSSLVGKTGGTRIDKYRSLIMPPRFVRQAVANKAQSLVLSVLLGAYLGVRLTNAHFEYAQFVYKYALN